jgi:hypothetical protein
VVALKPAEEAGPSEAPLGQDHRINASRQRPNHSKERFLLKLVLAVVRREGIAVVG